MLRSYFTLTAAKQSSLFYSSPASRNGQSSASSQSALSEIARAVDADEQRMAEIIIKIIIILKDLRISIPLFQFTFIVIISKGFAVKLTELFSITSFLMSLSRRSQTVASFMSKPK